MVANIKSKAQQYGFVIFLFLFSLALRLFLLDRFPIGMTHDELDYAMNAKSLYLTRENMPLTSPALFDFGNRDVDAVTGELPSFIIAPFIGPLDLNQFNVRYIYAIIGSFLVVVVYLLTERLFGKSLLSRMAGILMAVNPWSFHFSRTAFEHTLAAFFYLAGTYVFISTDRWRQFAALPLFVGGFLSYLGAKPLFAPLIIILFVYKFMQKINYRKPLIIFAVIALSIFLGYYATLKLQPIGIRMGELVIFNPRFASGIVDLERKQAIPNLGLEFFSNKAVVLGKRVVNVYLGAFSTEFLFTRGEARGAYSFWQHGMFYYLDFPLIILGIIALYLLNKKAFWLMVLLLASSPFASSLDILDESYAVRSFFMFPFLVIFAAAGMWKIYSDFGKKIFLFVSFIYFLLVINFLNLYFYRYPVYSAEGFFFSEKILSSYLSRVNALDQVRQINVYVRAPKIIFEEYLFHQNLYITEEAVRLVNEKLKKRNFSDRKIVFTNDCPKDTRVVEGEISIYDRKLDCAGKKDRDLSILSLADAGEIFLLRNDVLCKNQEIPRYYRLLDSQKLKANQLSNFEFCENWIARQ